MFARERRSRCQPFSTQFWTPSAPRSRPTACSSRFVATRTFLDVAGLKHLREWVDKRRSALTPEGQRFGLVPPKGVLITGVQGCGKSMAARAIAGEWGIELVRLDAGSLYDKYVGESEKRLHKALDLAQKLAPVVMWIDEIEKAFASAGSNSDADAGLFKRLLATLLTWMQDHQSSVFLAATSNNISNLPPEMLRKGRFDEIFFVDLPDADVRIALFAIHLKNAAAMPLGSICKNSLLPPMASPAPKSSKPSPLAFTPPSAKNNNSPPTFSSPKFATPNPSASPAPKTSKP